MTRFAHRPFWNPLLQSSDTIRRSWGWLLSFGLLTLLLGCVAVVYTGVATLTTVLFVGWITLFGGLTQAFASFYARHWSGFLLHLAGGILGVIIGLMLLFHPALGALALTLLMAVYFLVSGAVRTVAAVAMRFEHWGWSLVNGIITLVLGAIIWAELPISAVWVLGLFVGIDLIFAGWTLVSLAMVARELSHGAPPAMPTA